MTDLPQAMENKGDVGPKDSTVLVAFVDHHQLEIAKEPSPLILVMLQDREVQHVRIGEHQLNVLTNLWASR